MGTLWATNDVHTQERANRIAIAARLGLPMYDVDDAGTIQLPVALFGGALGTSLATIWAPGTLGMIQSISLTNSTGTDRLVQLYLIEPGASTASVARQIFKGTISAFETITVQIPYFVASGATFAGLASAAAAVFYHVTLAGLTTNPAGMRLKPIEGALTTVAGTTLYTVPGDVRHANLLAITICNDAAVARTYSVSLPGVTYFFLGPLQPDETVWIEPLAVLSAGQPVFANSGVDGVGSVRLTVLEFL